MAETMLRTMALPWSREPGENLRFGLTLGVLLLIFVPLAWWIPRVHLPAPTREKLEQVPPQLARLIQSPAPKVVPPKPLTPPKAPEKPKPKPEPKPEPKKAKPEPAKPAPSPKVRPTPKPVTSPRAVPESAEQARSVAQHSGLLAMQDQLAAMRDMTTDTSPPKTLTTLGASTPQAQSGPQAVVDEADATAGSGGVANSADPREQVALSRHQTERIKAAAHGGKREVAHVRHHLDGQGTRSMGGIRKTFDQNKTALFDLYNRALRMNPLLQGKVLLELVIEPDGSVASCKVVSSELHDAHLEQEIVSRVELFDFGRQNVPARTVQMPIDFLPP